MAESSQERRWLQAGRGKTVPVSRGGCQVSRIRRHGRHWKRQRGAAAAKILGATCRQSRGYKMWERARTPKRARKARSRQGGTTSRGHPRLQTFKAQQMRRPGGTREAGNSIGQQGGQMHKAIAERGGKKWHLGVEALVEPILQQGGEHKSRKPQQPQNHKPQDRGPQS